MSNRQNAEPSLRALSFILRHKGLWPEGFRWNYQSCMSCAMGLAHVVWEKQVTSPDFAKMADVFKMNPADASRIFMLAGYNVTPEDVADKIDALETACPERRCSGV